MRKIGDEDGTSSLFKQAIVIGVLLSLAIELIAPGVIGFMDWISPYFAFLVGILILMLCIYYYRKRRWIGI